MSSITKRSKYEIDMCNGTIMDKLISFSLPLMLSGILQLMFNAVDIIVIGRFSGSQSLESHWERMYYQRDFMQRVRTKRCQRLYIRRSHLH